MLIELRHAHTDFLPRWIVGGVAQQVRLYFMQGFSTCSPRSGFTSFPPSPHLLSLLFFLPGSAQHLANTLSASRGGRRGEQRFNYYYIFFWNNGHEPVIHFECLSKALLVFVFLDLTSHHLTHAYRIEIARRSRRQRAGCGVQLRWNNAWGQSV